MIYIEVTKSLLEVFFRKVVVDLEACDNELSQINVS